MKNKAEVTGIVLKKKLAPRQRRFNVDNYDDDDEYAMMIM